MTHICVSKLTSIGSDNVLSPGRRQAIIWTNAGISLIGPLGTNFNEMLIEIHAFSFTKIHLKMSSGKWRSFCLGLNVLMMSTMAILSRPQCVQSNGGRDVGRSATPYHLSLIADIHEIKQLLCSVGFGDVWYSQGVANPVGFINAFRVRIRDIYKQNWNASLQNSPRARFFRSVVNEHQFYNQLDMLDKKSHRIALARFMASSHRLGVETGRWARPIIPFEQRLCENCQKLDDEYHFLLECTKLSELRKKCIPRYFYLRPSMFKCVQLLNSNDTKTIRMLGRYVYQAFSQIV